MAILLSGAPPPTIDNYKFTDLLTGNSSIFTGNNGNWTNNNGTLTHDSTVAYMWPNNSTGSLKHVTTATPAYVECAIPGTFKAGVSYSAYLVFTYEEDLVCGTKFEFGLMGSDVATHDLVTYDPKESWNGGRHAMIALHWVPTADRSGVKVRVTRTEASGSGTRTLHISYCKVIRPHMSNGLVIPHTPKFGSTQPWSGLSFVAHTTGQEARLSIGGKNNGGLILDSYAGTKIASNSDGSTDFSSVAAGAEGVRLFTAWGDSATDLSDKGIEMDAGPDGNGLMISQRTSTTLQLYPTVADTVLQLRHRGTGGWAVSDDGAVNARVESYFEWVFTKAGALSVATNVAGYFKTGYKCRIDSADAHVGTAPTGQSLIVDINDDGTTVFTSQGNRPTIAAGATDDAAGAADGGTAIAAGSVISLDVDQVGSGTAGSDLTVIVRGRYIW